MSARCRTCRAPVVWAVLPSGRRIPLDPEPDPAGRVRLDAIGPATDRAAMVLPTDEAEAAHAAGEDLYVSHFATCPQADQHRRR